MLISDALKAGLCSAEAALDLMDTDRILIKNIIENIMFLGIPDTSERIIGDVKECENTKKKGSKQR